MAKCASLEHSGELGNQALTHMLTSPSRWNHELRRSLLAPSHATLGKGVCAQIELFLSLFPVHANSDLLLQSVLELLHWKRGLPRRLSCVWLSKAVLSSSSLTAAKRGRSWFTGQCRVLSRDWGPSAFHLTHRRARPLPGPLVWGAGSHSSQEGTFVCIWMLNCRCRWGG